MSIGLSILVLTFSQLNFSLYILKIVAYFIHSLLTVCTQNMFQHNLPRPASILQSLNMTSSLQMFQNQYNYTDIYNSFFPNLPTTAGNDHGLFQKITAAFCFQNQEHPSIPFLVTISLQMKQHFQLLQIINSPITMT